MEDFDKIPALGRFWAAATTICTDVALLHPDLTVGLLRTGWAPLFAARVLWEHVCDTPFPPALPINFGIEKQISRIRPFFNGWDRSHEEEGRFLTWMARQHDWQQELRELVAVASSQQTTPRRVLVVDEFVYSGTTRIAVLGLFLTTFPRAKTRFLRGMAANWKAPLTQAWMERYYPRTLARMLAAAGCPKAKIPYPVNQIASGTEDVHPESLYWRRISREGKLMAELTQHLPYEAWMECPVWINTTIARYVRWRADRTGWTPQVGLRENRNQPTSDRLNNKTLLWYQLHKQGQVTYRDVCRIFGISAKKSKYFLERMARSGELYQIGDEPMSHYTLAPQEMLDRFNRRRRNVERWTW